MEEFGCGVCGFMRPNREDSDDEDASRYDFKKSKFDMRFRNYSLWPLDSPERINNVVGPYDYVQYIAPDWLKLEVKRLFFQPMPAGNSPWPSQHSLYNAPGVHSMDFAMHAARVCTVEPGMISPPRQPFTYHSAPHPSPTVPTFQMTSVHVYLCVKLGHGALSTTCLTNGEQSFNGKSISSSSNSIGKPLPLWVLSESTVNILPDGNGIQFPPALNKVVSKGRSLSPATPSTKTFHPNMHTELSSSPEEIDCITKNNGADIVERAWCKFCFKNGETISFVSSHNLRDPIKNVVQCPVLRAHRCEACQATGDFAHTRTYCPIVRTLEGNVYSTTIALKSTRRLANGKMRTAAATSLRQKKKCVPCSLTESFTYLTAQ